MKNFILGLFVLVGFVGVSYASPTVMLCVDIKTDLKNTMDQVAEIRSFKTSSSYIEETFDFDRIHVLKKYNQGSVAPTLLGNFMPSQPGHYAVPSGTYSDLTVTNAGGMDSWESIDTLTQRSGDYAQYACICDYAETNK